MRKWNRIAAVAMLVLLAFALRASAQDHPPTPAPAAHPPDASHAETDAMPHLSTDAAWVPPVLIVIAGMFLSAAVIGPAVRSELVEEAPHDHDDHGHGH